MYILVTLKMWNLPPYPGIPSGWVTILGWPLLTFFSGIFFGDFWKFRRNFFDQKKNINFLIFFFNFFVWDIVHRHMFYPLHRSKYFFDKTNKNKKISSSNIFWKRFAKNFLLHKKLDSSMFQDSNIFIVYCFYIS